MTAKKYLQQIRLLDLKIDQKIQEKEDLLTRAEGRTAVSGDPNKVQTSRSADGPMRHVDEAVDLEHDIDRLIDTYTTMRDRIINQIHELDDARYVELLQLKYVGQRMKSGRMHYYRLEEIACIIRAQRIAEAALQRLHSELHTGITEREAAARLNYYMALGGSEKPSFDTILLFGENTSKPHGVPGDRALQPGDFVLADFGAVYRGYHSDMTRTVAFGSASHSARYASHSCWSRNTP